MTVKEKAAVEVKEGATLKEKLWLLLSQTKDTPLLKELQKERRRLLVLGEEKGRTPSV